MVIGIDIRPLMDKRYSGVALYTMELITAMLAQDQSNEYRLFYNGWRAAVPELPIFKAANVSMVKLGYPNKIFNYALLRLLGRPRLDILTGADIFLLPHINFAAFSARCPVVVVVHDVSWLRFPYFFTRRKNIWHRALGLRRLLGRAQRVVAVSAHTGRDLVELCGVNGQKLRTVSSGISANYRRVDAADANLARVRQSYGLPENFILYIGNIEPRKNIESIIEAYGIYRAAHPAALERLVIAGAPAWKHNVVRAVASRSVYRADIIFTGYVAERDKVYLYNLARLFVFPSFYEGFGFPPLEAAVCGTPVITANVSSLPEVAGEFAVLVNPYDVNELAGAIETVLTDSGLRAELSARGEQQARKYTWEKCARETLAVLREAADSMV